MSRERDALKVLVETQRQTIEAQERELRQLRAALRAFTEEPVRNDDEDVSMNGEDPVPEPAPGPSMNEAEVKTEDDSGIDDDDDDEEPFWDPRSATYFCGACAWEIADGMCQACCRKYDAYDVHLDPDGEPLPESENMFAGRDEDYRFTNPRGTTPLLEVDSARLRPDTVAYGYAGRVNEYRALLARGATRLMCETFYLSFSQETGIVLEIEGDLFEEWAGEDLWEAKSWKVYLGREIRLEEGDEDGSLYIDAVLEEALLFGAYTESHVFWETVQTEPQHWVTRPTAELQAPPSPGLSDVSSTDAVWDHLDLEGKVRPRTLAHDDYLWDNSADEDEECDSVEDEEGQMQLGWDGEGGWGPNGPRLSDNENAMAQDRTVRVESNGEDGDDEDDGSPPSEADTFDSDFDSEEELSGDEPVLAGNVEYFRNFYNPQALHP